MSIRTAFRRAVVVQTAVCGSLCGSSITRVVRKHPGGWMAAEELFFVIS